MLLLRMFTHAVIGAYQSYSVRDSTANVYPIIQVSAHLICAYTHQLKLWMLR
jgi:hypothetical protein